MQDLGKVWKQTAKSLIIAATDLGYSMYATVKAGVDLAVDWAKKDNPHVQTEATEVADEPAEAEPGEAEQAAGAAEADAQTADKSAE